MVSECVSNISILIDKWASSKILSYTKKSVPLHGMVALGGEEV
jgi:hypothetical protein